MSYVAPIAEQVFTLETTADIQSLLDFSCFSNVDISLTTSIIEESGRFSAEILAPLNRLGDVQGVALQGNIVKHPAGFAGAYKRYVEGGWQALSASPEHGGQGLPLAIATAVGEQFAAANMAFSLCMVLTSGAAEALTAFGNDRLKALYLPKLTSGEWTGTMNLTEPQAGSDVGALRTIATPADDGTWRVRGTKIFISWGEHQLSENIIHFVLARTPGAPGGTKGLSLFLVPKFLPDADGRLCEENDLRCVSIERKLGIHASPTCTMSFGDNDRCVGWLIGEINGGMRAMFAMMNPARLNIGLEGVAVAERAFQGALAYARERIQSSLIGGGPPVQIIHHPDVQRSLLTMKALTQAVRAIAYFNAATLDRARHDPAPDRRAAFRGLADLLTPITKAYSTDVGVEVASLGLQVFGGMGYIEETGAAQHYRDIRIAPIYEGTNGIQALDLVGRKFRADGGQHWHRLNNEILGYCESNCDLNTPLAKASRLLAEASQHVARLQPADAAAVSTPFLKLFGLVLAGYLLARQRDAAELRLKTGARDRKFFKAKIDTVRFYLEEILPGAHGQHIIVMSSTADKLMNLEIMP